MTFRQNITLPRRARFGRAGCDPAYLPTPDAERATGVLGQRLEQQRSDPAKAGTDRYRQQPTGPSDLGKSLAARNPITGE